jgi:hypothetical protein
MRMLVAMLGCGLVLAAGCGDKGKDGGNPPRTRGGDGTEPAPDSPKPGTYVLTDTLPYLQPELVGCLRAGEGYGVLPELAGLVPDGVFDEWAATPLALADPLGDAPAGVDFGTVAVARVGDDLALAVTTQRAPGTHLIVELGGVLLRRERLTMERRRLFRFGDDGLFEHDGLPPHEDGASPWLPVEPGQFRAGAGASGLELRLGERLLGDALTWPAFWVKLHIEASADGGRYDAGAAIAFASVLADEDTAFAFSGCQEWAGQGEPFHLRFVFDRATGGESRQRIEPRESVANWTFALVRAGFDAASRQLGGLTLPARETTVYVVNAKPPGEIGPASGSPRPDPAYDGLVLVGEALAAGATEYYPQGELFTQAAAHAARLEVLGRFAEAPRALVNAVTRAVVDHVVQETLGYSYWLDRFKSQVDGFLAESDAARPHPLTEGGWEAKEMGLGHLLGALFAPRDLLAAWSAAAERARGGEEPADSLLGALKAARATDEEREALDQLWSGWVVPGAYAEGYGPDQLADPDFDGLPSFLERRIGTRADRPDSDADGWTDYAELVTGSDPLAATQNPSVLVPDGSFGDWLELLPKKVVIDRGHSGSCPQAADVSHYAAVAGHEDLLIGAFATDFLEEEPAAKWEAVIDLPSQQRQLLVTTTSGSRVFVVKDAASGDELLVRERAVAMGRGTVELPLTRSDLGIEPWTFERGVLKIRLRTVYTEDGDERFCDETGWFAPEFNE